MTNVKSLFPKAFFSWSDRTDEISNVYANDPNSIASEVISVEKTLGIMPQVEKNPATGHATLPYADVDTRLSAAAAGVTRPYVELTFPQQVINNGNTFAANVGNAPGKSNTYTVSADTWGYYNGTDVTIRSNGMYLIHAKQSWPFNSAGYVGLHLYLNTAWESTDIWDWSMFAQSGPTKWDKTGFNERRGLTQVSWMGTLSKGDRVQIVSENGTPSTTQTCLFGALRVYDARLFPNTY